MIFFKLLSFFVGTLVFCFNGNFKGHLTLVIKISFHSPFNLIYLFVLHLHQKNMISHTNTSLHTPHAIYKMANFNKPMIASRPVLHTLEFAIFNSFVPVKDKDSGCEEE